MHVFPRGVSCCFNPTSTVRVMMVFLREAFFDISLVLLASFGSWPVTRKLCQKRRKKEMRELAEASVAYRLGLSRLVPRRAPRQSSPTGRKSLPGYQPKGEEGRDDTPKSSVGALRQDLKTCRGVLHVLSPLLPRFV